ncbi:hypothetical protein NQ318_010735 [Aromia moschata]|uniref:N-acetyltransferase domain-containing protein n=1 Tax=Aromia moschata TaxID=1265417 RepID=A0AAV8YJK8_9CUCU|nr:hypothetical protein NQ318_010735 [Aromia moschata]
MSYLFVKKNHRRRGIGQRLLQDSKSLAADCGYKVVRCDATSEFTSESLQEELERLIWHTLSTQELKCRLSRAIKLLKTNDLYLSSLEFKRIKLKKVLNISEKNLTTRAGGKSFNRETTGQVVQDPRRTKKRGPDSMDKKSLPFPSETLITTRENDNCDLGARLLLSPNFR